MSLNIGVHTDGTVYIEQDALRDETHAPPPIRDHPEHDETVKSVIMTPRMDLGFIQKMRAWWKSELTPGIHVVHKDNDPLRYMVLVTSNSYEDRENETITTKALEEYEASCYPGEDLYHNPNQLLYWHDDDVVMGDIVAVSVSGPFLVEVAKEADTPVAKVLWDIAEETEHAGVSHRFGYLEKDRDPDGTFQHIFKGESTWLPKIDLAANELTYAGVVGMASPASDKWLDETFERIAGIKNASAKLHAKTGELEKELEARGLAHKAFPPAVAGKKPAPPMAQEAEAAAVEMDAAETEAADVEMEDEVEDVGETKSSMDDLKRMSIVMDSLFNMVQRIIDESAASEMDRVGMFKELKELKELRVSEKAQEKTTLDLLEEKLKALEARQQVTEKKLDLAPRSVTQTLASADPEFVKKSVNEAIDGVEKAKTEEALTHDPFWGNLKPLPGGK